MTQRALLRCFRQPRLEHLRDAQRLGARIDWSRSHVARYRHTYRQRCRSAVDELRALRTFLVYSEMGAGSTVYGIILEIDELRIVAVRLVPG